MHVLLMVQLRRLLGMGPGAKVTKAGNGDGAGGARLEKDRDWHSIQQG